jgi:Tfp pilus assembly protein PilF
VEVGDSCANSGNDDLAALHYYRALRDAPQHAPNLAAKANTLVTDRPASAAARLLQGEIQLLTGSLDAAEISLQQGLQLAPTSEYVYSALLQSSARLAALRGDYVGAAQQFAAARQTYRFDSALNAGLEVTMRAVQRSTQATNQDDVADLRSYLSANPYRSIELYSEIAEDPALRQAMHWGFNDAMSGAVAAFDVQQQADLVRSLLRLSDPATAQPLVHALVEQFSRQQPLSIEQKRSYLDLAELALRVDSQADAKSVYSNMIENWPGEYEAYYHRANLAYTAEHDVAAAEQDLLAAVNLAPQEKSVYLLLLQIYRAAGQEAAIDTLLQSAKANNPQQAWPLHLAGETYLRNWTAAEAGVVDGSQNRIAGSD